MLVDTADARRASTARMPGSQVVRKMERQRAREAEDRQVSILLCLHRTLCGSVFVLTAFAAVLLYWTVQTDRRAVTQSVQVFGQQNIKKSLL